MITGRFTTNYHSPISWGIRAFTWSKWSHFEFLIPGEGYLGAHLGECRTPEGLVIPSGVQIRPFDYDPGCTYQLADLECPDSIRDKILAAATSQIGKPYDLTALFGIVAHRDWKEPDSWFCTELGEWACETGGLPLLNDAGEFNRITPGMLYMSPLWKFRNS